MQIAVAQEARLVELPLRSVRLFLRHAFRPGLLRQSLHESKRLQEGLIGHVLGLGAKLGRQIASQPLDFLARVFHARHGNNDRVGDLGHIDLDLSGQSRS